MAAVCIYSLLLFIIKIFNGYHLPLTSTSVHPHNSPVFNMNNHHRSLLEFTSCIEAIGSIETVIPTHNLTADWTYPGNGTNDFRAGCASISSWAGAGQPIVPTMRSGDKLENCSAVSQYCFINTQTNIINYIRFEFQYSWGYEEKDNSSIYSYFKLAMISNENTELWSWTSPAYNDSLYSWDICDGQPTCYSPVQIHNFDVHIDVSQAVDTHFAIYFINRNKNLHILPETLVIKIQWMVSDDPTKNPSNYPTVNPSNHPTVSPSNYPTVNPSNHPTNSPSNNPTYSSTSIPLRYPTGIPSDNPTFSPSKKPSNDPPTMAMLIADDEYDKTSMIPTKTVKESIITTLSSKHAENSNDDDWLYWICIFGGIIIMLLIIIIMLLLIIQRKLKMAERDISNKEMTEMRLRRNNNNTDLEKVKSVSTNDDDETDNNFSGHKQNDHQEIHVMNSEPNTNVHIEDSFDDSSVDEMFPQHINNNNNTKNGHVERNTVDNMHVTKTEQRTTGSIMKYL